MDAIEKKRALAILKIRKGLAEYAIDVLRNEAKGDKRQPSALRTYRRQLSKINKKIEELEKTEVKPAPTIISLKPGILSAKVPK